MCSLPYRLTMTINKHCKSFIRNYTTVCKIISTPNTTEKVEIKGWVKSLRKLKSHIFFDVSDGSSPHKLQVVVSASNKPENLTVGASVVVNGYLGSTPQGQPELSAENIEICGPCVVTDGYPFLPRKQYPPEYIRQFLHLRPRTNKFSALLRIRSQATSAIHQHFMSEGYVNIHTPILTSNDCEGAGEIFKVLPENKKLLQNMRKADKNDDEAYFNCKSYLTVSGQLHLEAAVHSLGKVYTFGPTFRAENSKSRLHLSEFYMVEAEAAFTDKIEQLVDIIERLIKQVSKEVISKCSDDIEMCRENNVGYEWINSKFPVMAYEEAKEIIRKNSDKFKNQFREEVGFTKDHELFLVNYCGSIPVFIINWPKGTKPFYMRDCETDQEKVSALDLLAPNVGEIVGGSLRENDYERLKAKLPNHDELNWYLDLRKFGGVSTGGFGLGFERYLQMLLAINNIKDTIPFPRWPHSCSL